MNHGAVLKKHQRKLFALLILILSLVLVTLFFLRRSNSSRSWVRHSIDHSSQGADGVKLGDANHDGLTDIVTAWEQGGVIRLYLNPGPEKARDPWKYVEVGRVESAEDALLFDFDGNQSMDVVSACEGNMRSIFFHRAPQDPSQYFSSKLWNTTSLPASSKKAEWMFCGTAQIDEKRGIDLVAGSKEENAEIGWFESPLNPADLESWVWHPLSTAGWVMSLLPTDMDGDGDADLLVSDRKGKLSGIFWLQNPLHQGTLNDAWRKHWIGAQEEEVMFLSETDLDKDGMKDVIATVKANELIFFHRQNLNGQAWRAYRIETPKTAGVSKSVAAGDINLDGKIDLVFSCEKVHRKSGVMWLEDQSNPTKSEWKPHDISGQEGIKFDLVELLDLDADGDLDVVTTEEAVNLGVVWYENPVK